MSFYGVINLNNMFLFRKKNKKNEKNEINEIKNETEKLENLNNYVLSKHINDKNIEYYNKLKNLSDSELTNELNKQQNNLKDAYNSNERMYIQNTLIPPIIQVLKEKNIEKKID